MEERIEKIIIAKDNWPLEQFVGRPVTNFFRRLLHGHHIECRDCWNSKRVMKVAEAIDNGVVASAKSYNPHAH